ATVSAASGAGIDKVIADAMSALEAKRVQLGLPSPTSDAAPEPLPVAPQAIHRSYRRPAPETPPAPRRHPDRGPAGAAYRCG
ncbi:hypothetical protein, partial [Klebsiella pneumoniae]|uniref:hypothetical protein n=1 Tax=Klebsiella pneumoniae TaxID=573 RepID=UPI001C5970D5